MTDCPGTRCNLLIVAGLTFSIQVSSLADFAASAKSFFLLLTDTKVTLDES